MKTRVPSLVRFPLLSKDKKIEEGRTDTAVFVTFNPYTFWATLVNVLVVLRDRFVAANVKSPYRSAANPFTVIIVAGAGVAPLKVSVPVRVTFVSSFARSRLN